MRLSRSRSRSVKSLPHLKRRAVISFRKIPGNAFLNSSKSRCWYSSSRVRCNASKSGGDKRMRYANKLLRKSTYVNFGLHKAIYAHMMAPQVLDSLPATEARLVMDQQDRQSFKSPQDLLPLVYEELRKLAAARMAAEWDTSTLQPTALVHEAWLRLATPGQPLWNNQAQFFAAAAEAM